MHTHLRPDVLRLVCAVLPSPQAKGIRSRAADDLNAYVEAYDLVLKTHSKLPPDLEDEFLRCILGEMDCRESHLCGCGPALASEEHPPSQPTDGVPSPGVDPATTVQQSGAGVTSSGPSAGGDGSDGGEFRVVLRPSEEGPMVLEVSGIVDICVRKALVDAGATACLASPQLAVDATGIDFVDLVGLGALVAVIEGARRAGVPVTSVRRSPPLQRLLDIVGMTHAWP